MDSNRNRSVSLNLVLDDELGRRPVGTLKATTWASKSIEVAGRENFPDLIRDWMAEMAMNLSSSSDIVSSVMMTDNDRSFVIPLKVPKTGLRLPILGTFHISSRK